MSGNEAFSKLLAPGKIGKLTLKNRIVRSAAGTDYLDEAACSLSAKQIPFYEALARGGVGMIIIGAAVVDYPMGAVIQTQSRIDDDKFIPGWKEVTEVVHKYDCPVMMQFMHAGVWHGLFFKDGQQGYSSSVMSREELAPLGLDFGLPTRELSKEEIKGVINKFVAAAVRARQAGFDGIELSMATCHLGNSFLSRIWNKRRDEYGVDTFENRSRFTTEMVQAVKNKLGKDFPVGVLINGGEFGYPNGTTPDEAAGIAREIEKAGADWIHVRGYGYGVAYLDLHIPDSIFFPEPPRPLGKPLDGRRQVPGVVVPLAAAVKKAVAIPVFAVGRLDPVLGEKILEEGKADFIAMQRRLIADPDLPKKVAEGRLDDIAPCTACLACFACMDRFEPVACRINAATGGTQDYNIEKAPFRKKVVVVGGGPAGMEAARVAALRGHDVILFEKGKKLGGLLRLAAILKNPALEDVASIAYYLKNQITKLGVSIRLGKKVTAEQIAGLKPDVVIIAAGGIPVLPEIKGIQKEIVLGTPGLYRMLKGFLSIFSPGAIRWLSKIWTPVGERVVIMGGGIHGCELAEFLVKRGRKVTMVDTAESMQDNRWPMFINTRIFTWLNKKGVTMLTGVKYEEINDKGLVITTADGQKQTLEADTVIPVTPLAANNTLAADLQGKVAEIYTVGDAAQDGLIINAVADGYRTARTL